MSFSVNLIGKPEAIKRKLAEESERLTGQGKVEFDAVKPALDILLDQQVNNGIVQLNCNGHATTTGDDQHLKTYGSCSVELKTLGQLTE